METRISNDRTGRESRDVEEGFEEQYQTTTTTSGGSKERPARRTSSFKAKLFTARTLLGILSMVSAVVLIGIIGHMVARYGDKGFVHVSLVFVLITSILTLTFQALDLTTLFCLRDRLRTFYPGAYVGIHICISLACIATMGYVGIWVSTADEESDRDLDLEPDEVEIPPIVEALATKYHTTSGQGLRGRRGRLYRLGIALLVVTVMMLLINFVLSVVACKEVRRKDAAREQGDEDDPRDPARYRIPAAARRSRTPRDQAPRFPGYVVTVNDGPVVSRPPPAAMSGAGMMPPRGVDLGVEISGSHEDWSRGMNMRGAGGGGRSGRGSPADIDLTPVSPGSSEMTEVLAEKDSGIGIGRSGR